MMKSLLIVCLLTLFLALVPSVLAEGTKTSTPGGLKKAVTKIEDRVQKIETNLKDKIEKIATRTADVKNPESKTERFRNSVVVRWGVFNRAIATATNLLDKLQVKIDRAKAAGADMKASDAAMADARAKLADAKAKLAEIQSKKGTAMTKAEFKTVYNDFKIILRDLQAVKKDASIIIQNLRKFNASKEATKSGERSSTTSAEKD